MSAKRAQEPRLRRPMSAAQRAKLSATQRAYVARDPRWPAHRRKLMDANLARRRTLAPDEIAAITAMRNKGRTFSYIAEEIGIDDGVLRREFRANGFSTARVRPERRAKPGTGPWRSFDEPGCLHAYRNVLQGP